MDKVVAGSARYKCSEVKFFSATCRLFLTKRNVILKDNTFCFTPKSGNKLMARIE
jgi:hypothetical protein